MIFIFYTFCFSTVIGIDLGHSYVKASLLSRDQPLHFALNSNSKRLTPNYFAFWNRTRSTNYTSVKNWNESTADSFEFAFGDTAREQCLRFPKLCLKGISSSFLNNKTHFTLRGYEIMALSIQSLIQSISVAERINDTTVQVVIAVPPSMGPREKSYLYAALSISNNINALQFIDTTTAPSQVYALERYKGEPNKAVAFVDIGGKGTRVNIFVFDNSTGTTNITQIASQFDEMVGGETIDQLLAQKVAKKYNVNLNNTKTYFNFLDDISMVKEMLTMHPSVDLKFEDDDDDEEKLITVTRQDLIETGESINKTIDSLIQSALVQSKLDKIENVEMIGGCTHIPFIQERVRKAFNVSKLKHTLNAESVVAIGAGYIGAERSAQFIVRPTNRSVMLTNSVILQTNHQVFKIFNKGDSEDSSPVVKMLVNPIQKFVISSVTAGNILPYMQFSVKNLTKPTQVELSFIHNYFLMPVPMSANVNENNYDFDVDNNVGWEVSSEDLLSSSKKVTNLLELQKIRREKEKVANSFESELLKLGNFVYDAKNISDDEKGFIKNIVKENMDWFESLNGIVTDIAEMKAKLDKIKNETEEIVERGTEHARKPLMAKKIDKTLLKSKKILDDSMMVGKIEATLQSELLSAISSTEKWIQENSNNDFEKVNSKDIQNKRAELKAKMINLRAKMNSLLKKQKKAENDYNEL